MTSSRKHTINCGIFGECVNTVFLTKKLQRCISLVEPITKYAGNAWVLHTTANIMKLEKVQHKAISIWYMVCILVLFLLTDVSYSLTFLLSSLTSSALGLLVTSTRKEYGRSLTKTTPSSFPFFLKQLLCGTIYHVTMKIVNPFPLFLRCYDCFI